MYLRRFPSQALLCCSPIDYLLKLVSITICSDVYLGCKLFFLSVVQRLNVVTFVASMIGFEFFFDGLIRILFLVDYFLLHGDLIADGKLPRLALLVG